ncbi:hypothetical protein C8F01DRAFT_638425 [Mycena amicta]|nr:hypothetical protein C8F01DRAFT_638425 [Mycena amicta]
MKMNLNAVFLLLVVARAGSALLILTATDAATADTASMSVVDQAPAPAPALQVVVLIGNSNGATRSHDPPTMTFEPKDDQQQHATEHIVAATGTATPVFIANSTNATGTDPVESAALDEDAANLSSSTEATVAVRVVEETHNHAAHLPVPPVLQDPAGTSPPGHMMVMPSALGIKTILTIVFASMLLISVHLALFFVYKKRRASTTSPSTPRSPIPLMFLPWTWVVIATIRAPARAASRMSSSVGTQSATTTLINETVEMVPVPDRAYSGGGRQKELKDAEAEGSDPKLTLT